MRRPPWSKAELKDIRRRYERGETLDSIGAAYGITRQRALQLVQRAGGALRVRLDESSASKRARKEQNKQRRKQFEQRVEWCIDLAARGLPLSVIAQRLGYSHDSVRTYLLHAGWRAERRGPGALWKLSA